MFVLPESKFQKINNKRYYLNNRYGFSHRKNRQETNIQNTNKVNTKETDKRNRKSPSFGIVFLLIFIGTIVIVTQTGFLSRINNSGSSQNNELPILNNEPQPYVSLELHIENIQGEWIQDSNDKIHYIGTFTYSIYNEGTKDADVDFMIKDGNEILSSYETKHQVPKKSMKTDTLNFEIEGTSIIQPFTLIAECDSDQCEQKFVIEKEFPRYITEKYEPMFVTLRKDELIQLKEEITGNPIIPDWMELRKWVGSNIEYEYDTDQFGPEEYWQFPLETLKNGRGDCEDVAILLCTLLRIDGWDSDEVYVIIGETPSGEGHAWVILKLTSILGEDLWVSLEPTVGGWIESTLSDILSTGADRDILFSFNDEGFITQ